MGKTFVGEMPRVEFIASSSSVDSKAAGHTQNKAQEVSAERLINESKQLPSNEVESFIDANTSDLYDIQKTNLSLWETNRQNRWKQKKNASNASR